MTENFLEVAEWVIFELFHDGKLRRFRTHVLKSGDGKFTASAPTDGVNVIALGEGDVVPVVAATPLGLYCFDGRVLRFQAQPQPHVVLSVPREQKRLQRREYVRVEERVPVTFSYKAAEWTADWELETDVVASGTTRDVSAGGLRAYIEHCTTSRLPWQGAQGDVSFKLPDGALVTCRARVHRVVAGTLDASKKGRRPEISLEFQDLPERERDRITRYVFARQAEWRRLGLL